MRIIFRFLILLTPVLGFVGYASFKVMNRIEQRWLAHDLARRSKLILASSHDYFVDNIRANHVAAIENVLNRISQDERLTGAMLCTKDETLLTKSAAVPKGFDCQGVKEKETVSELSQITIGTLVLHEAVLPIEDRGIRLGYLIVLHDASYMMLRHQTSARYLLALLMGLAFIFSMVTLLVYRWTMSQSVNKLKMLFRGFVTGDVTKMDSSFAKSEFSPLARDLSKVLHELRYAKDVVKESESALTWTPQRLRTDVQKYFGESRVCVISNREPYVHNRKGDQIEILLPASGLVTAVEPIVRACSGLWIAHGSGSADRDTADRSGKLLVPPGDPEYILKRVWLSREEEKGYYYGFSNEGLWPLCHIAHTRPQFESEDWAHYRAVNERFAEAFLNEPLDQKSIVLIQDYHFALLPEMIRRKKRDATLSLFWHIPWPNPEAFGICPWRKEILTGMLHSDLIGFHTQFHCNNFLDTVDRFLEARVDREQFSVTIQGHVCYIKPFPISIQWPSPNEIDLAQLPNEKSELLTELNLPQDIRIGVGVDRIDYTKGIVERLKSVERLLDQHPELIGKFVFIQVGAPSRTHIKRYQELNAEVQRVADEINWKFHRSSVPPILLKLSHHNSPDLYRYYRAADLCFVNPLHDGMNLVAKEFISARNDLRGVLVLSTFAGASRELGDALLINPYDLDECAAALWQALTMSDADQSQRMERLRATVADKNVYSWASSFLSEIHRITKLKESIETVERPQGTLRS